MQPSPTAVMRQRSRFVRFTCQICDKVFATQDTLNQHIATHRTPQKPSVLSFRSVVFRLKYKHLSWSSLPYIKNILYVNIGHDVSNERALLAKHNAIKPLSFTFRPYPIIEVKRYKLSRPTLQYSFLETVYFSTIYQRRSIVKIKILFN